MEDREYYIYVITNTVNGKQETAGGYHWMWLEDYLEQNKEK